MAQQTPSDRNPASAASREPVLFDAVLYPHRSATPRAGVIFLIIASMLFLMGGIFFLTLGAWPVFGFFGLDILLLAGAFWLNHRHARLRETVRLTASLLRVERIHPSGRRAGWDFQPSWTRVEMADPPRHGSPLALMSKGRRLVIGRFLNSRERLDFALALRRALARHIS